FMAVTGSVIPFTAIAWGELHISSGLAAIFNATTPLWTAIIAYWLTPNERPSPLNYLGVAAGFAGTGILIAPQLGDPLHAGVLGSLAAIAGAASYAVAAIGQRRLLPGVDPIEGSFWQMALATILILPIAAPALTHAHPTLVSVGASLVLGVAGSGVASILYYFLINSLGATRGASVTFLIPVPAVFWGSLLFQARTPTLTTDLDPDLLLKPECFQVTGSFKPRGAFNAILSLAARDPAPRGLITASSGNHAQAVALAARTAGLPAVVLIPEGANPAK